MVFRRVGAAAMLTTNRPAASPQLPQSWIKTLPRLLVASTPNPDNGAYLTAAALAVFAATANYVAVAEEEQVESSSFLCRVLRSQLLHASTCSKIENWSGTHVCRPGTIHTPESEAEVEALVAR
jgi:hypothetical protein